MTEARKELREALAKVQYNRDRGWFRNDPATREFGDDWEHYADQVFPPWDDVEDRSRYLDDADAAIALVGERMAERMQGHRLLWNKGTTVHSVLSDVEAEIRSLTQEKTNAEV